MKVAYYLEGRGQIFPYHFYVLVLGGLYYIFNNIKHHGPEGTSLKYHDSSKLINELPELKFPITIVMNRVDNSIYSLKPFHKSAFELIRDKVIHEDIDNLDQDYKIYSEYGETLLNNPYCDNPEIIFPFLRNLFLKEEKAIVKDITSQKEVPALEEVSRDIAPLKKGAGSREGTRDIAPLKKGAGSREGTRDKRIFITRRGSESQHCGLLKRSVINEEGFFKMLKKHNFEYIQLENYSEKEKIELFNTSEVIISSHSGALTYTLFANTQTKIIELLNKGPKNGPPTGHYLNIANTLKLNFNRYSDINEDDNGNFNIDCIKFENYLLTLLK